MDRAVLRSVKNSVYSVHYCCKRVVCTTVVNGLNIIKCGWRRCAAWRASEGQAAIRADIVSFG